MIDIVEALADPNLFGPWFAGPSWATWRAVLRAAFCLPMDAEDLRLFRGVAGDRAPPQHRVRELWCVVGRRGGKDGTAVTSDEIAVTSDEIATSAALRQLARGFAARSFSVDARHGARSFWRRAAA
jgi:hypothetical protein